jgi:hypothetical protein
MRVFAKGDTPVVPRSTLLDLDSLVEIARIQVPPDMRQRAPRYGRLGACSACRQPVLTHFDGAGRFLGCANVPEDTVFVLMPVTAAGRVVAMPALGTPPPPRIRRFKVARYTPAPITPLSGVPLTERRSLVRDVIMQAGEAGVREADVVDRLGIARGSVSEALAWLHAHQMINKREDSNSSS